MELAYRQVTQAELELVHKLESESYPEDEAASLEMFVYRWTEAPALTLACFQGDDMVGGIALRLLNKYTQTVASEQKDVTQILLICKSNLIPLYTRAGFTLRGKSDVVHGKDPWYELVLALTGTIGC